MQPPSGSRRAAFLLAPALLSHRHSPILSHRTWIRTSFTRRTASRRAAVTAVVREPAAPTLVPPAASSSLTHAPSPPSPPPPPSPWAYIWPRALLLGIAAVWGTNFATVKLLQSGIDAVPLPVAALARFGLAASFLAPMAYHEARRGRMPQLASVRDSVGIGLVVSVGYFAQSLSLMTTEANKSAFICSLAVVLVPLLERAGRLVGLGRGAQKEENPVVTWGAPLLAVLGVGLLELGGASKPCEGDLWALVQATGFALGFIGNAKAASKYPGFTLSITAVQLATVAGFSGLWACIDASTAVHSFALPDLSPVFASPANAIAVIYAGVVTTALTVWLENIALVHVSAAELAVLLSTEPFWAAAFAAVLLGETMGPQAVAGGAIILMACVLNQSKGIDFGKMFRHQSGMLARLCPMVALLQVFVANCFDPPPS